MSDPLKISDLPRPTEEEIVATFKRTDDEYWKSKKVLHFFMFLTLGTLRFMIFLVAVIIYALVLRIFALIHRWKIEDVQFQGGLATTFSPTGFRGVEQRRGISLNSSVKFCLGFMATSLHQQTFSAKHRIQKHMPPLDKTNLWARMLHLQL